MHVETNECYVLWRWCEVGDGTERKQDKFKFFWKNSTLDLSRATRLAHPCAGDVSSQMSQMRLVKDYSNFKCFQIKEIRMRVFLEKHPNR